MGTFFLDLFFIIIGFTCGEYYGKNKYNDYWRDLTDFLDKRDKAVLTHFKNNKDHKY